MKVTTNTCMRNVVSCGPTDRREAEARITRVYQHFGRPRPQFIWSRSPLAFARRIHLGTVWSWKPPFRRVATPIWDEMFQTNMASNEFVEKFSPYLEVMEAELTKVDGIRYERARFATMFIGPSCSSFCSYRASHLIAHANEICATWLPLDTVCFLIERPREVQLDNMWLPHSRKGAPAIEYTGWTTYAYRGRHIVPPPYMSARDLKERLQYEWTDHDAIAYAIERLGIAHVCREIGRPGDKDDFGQLWKIALTRNRNQEYVEDIVFVEVQNATKNADGEYDTYYLRVPNYIISPIQAVAWTFDIPQQEYKKIMVQA